MKIAATLVRTSIIAATALSLLACIETTGPREDPVEVRVAHAAPGLATMTLLMQGQVMFELPPLESVFFPLMPQPVTYAFAGANTVSHHVAQHAELNAIVLMNPDQPAVHHFPMDRRFARVRIMVINGDFSTTEPLTVRITGEGFAFEEAIVPGGHAVIDPDAGTFSLAVRPPGADGIIDLEPLSVVEGDNGFLIVLPHADPAIEYLRMLF
jgi:hypothetical protein